MILADTPEPDCDTFICRYKFIEGALRCTPDSSVQAPLMTRVKAYDPIKNAVLLGIEPRRNFHSFRWDRMVQDSACPSQGRIMGPFKRLIVAGAPRERRVSLGAKTSQYVDNRGASRERPS